MSPEELDVLRAAATPEPGEPATAELRGLLAAATNARNDLLRLAGATVELVSAVDAAAFVDHVVEAIAAIKAAAAALLEKAVLAVVAADEALDRLACSSPPPSTSPIAGRYEAATVALNAARQWQADVMRVAMGDDEWQAQLIARLSAARRVWGSSAVGRPT